MAGVAVSWRLISNLDSKQNEFAKVGGIVKSRMNHKRELFDGLIRLHVLLHAAHESIVVLAMMHELEHHGYRVGPGTLYPRMHGLERAGLLRSRLQRVEGRSRRLCRITSAGAAR